MARARVDAAGLQERGCNAEPVGVKRRPLPLPPELRVFWATLVVAFALAAVVSWVKWRTGQSVTNWDPLSDPPFGDLREYPGTYTLLHTRAFFFNVPDTPWAYPLYSPVAYPPFAAAIMAPIYLSGQPELVFLLMSGAWLLAMLGLVRIWMQRGGISAWTATLFPVTVAALSFPIARLLHQGNIELVVWIFTATGVWAWVREKNDLAALLWGCAAAMKLFPFALLALLLPRRKWRAFGLGVLSFIVATIWSLWWLGPTLADASYGSMRNVFGYQGTRLTEWTLNELVANHSLINLAKILAAVMHLPVAKLAMPYYAGGATILIIALFGKPWKLPLANQLLAVSAFMVMFPPMSYYHALVHMYAPLALLGCIAIRAAKAGVQVPGLQKTMLLFLPLFMPFPLLMYPQVFVFCGVVQSLALLMLFLCAFHYRFEIPPVAATAGPVR